jgi:hypothetical protein
MADTDAALKTQMFMSESARQNAMDLSTRISAGFQAASEAVRFESQVSQAMVGAAANFKQIQVDEWYKQEQVAMEARRINLAEKQAIALNEHRKAQLEAQNKRADSILEQQLERKKYQEEGEQYKTFDGEVRAEGRKSTADLDVINSQIEINKMRESELSKKLSDVSSISVANMPLAEKQAEIAKIKAELDIVRRNKITATEASIPLIQRAGKFSALSERVQRRSGSLESLREEFDTLRGINPQSNPNSKSYDPVSAAFPDMDKETGEYKEAPKANTNISTDKTSSFRFFETPETAPKAIERTVDDMYAVWNEKNYSPQLGRAVYEDLPEAAKIKFNQDAITLRIRDLAGMAQSGASVTESRRKKHQLYSDALNDGFQEEMDYMVPLIRQEAKKMYNQAENKPSTYSPNPDEVGNEYYVKAAQKIVGVNQPEGTPKPTDPLPLPGAAANPLADLGVDGDAPVDASAANRYIKLLGGATMESAASGNDEWIERKAIGLETYDKNLKQYQGRSEREYAVELNKLTDADLSLLSSIDLDSYSNVSGMGSQAPTLYKKETRRNVITNIIKSGKAAEILAEYSTRKSLSVEDIRLLGDARRELNIDYLQYDAKEAISNKEWDRAKSTAINKIEIAISKDDMNLPYFKNLIKGYNEGIEGYSDSDFKYILKEYIGVNPDAKVKIAGRNYTNLDLYKITMKEMFAE